MGAYPRGTGLNPVEGNGHFFPHAVSSIFRLSLTHTRTVRFLTIMSWKDENLSPECDITSGSDSTNDFELHSPLVAGSASSKV